MTSTKAATFISVVPGTMAAPSLGMVTNIQPSGNAMAFSPGLTHEYISANTYLVTENLRNDTRQSYSMSSKKKVEAIVGNLSMNYNMGKLGGITGEVNLDYKSTQDEINLTRSFNSWKAMREERLEFSKVDITSDLAGDFSEFTHIVSSILYGKAVAGSINLSSSSKKSDLLAKGQVEVDILSIPIGGEGSVEMEMKDIDKKYDVRSNFSTIGSTTNGTALVSARDFAEEIKKHADSSESQSGIIGYNLVEIRRIKSLKDEGMISHMNSFFRERILNRMFAMTTFLAATDAATGQTNAPYTYLTNQDEKDNYAQTMLEVNNEVSQGMVNIRNAIVDGSTEAIQDVLASTQFFSSFTYRLASEGTKLHSFGKLVAAAVEKRPVRPIGPFKYYVHHVMKTTDSKSEGYTFTYNTSLTRELPDDNAQVPPAAYAQVFLYGGTGVEDLVPLTFSDGKILYASKNNVGGSMIRLYKRDGIDRFIHGSSNRTFYLKVNHFDDHYNLDDLGDVNLTGTNVHCYADWQVIQGNRQEVASNGENGIMAHLNAIMPQYPDCKYEM